MGGYWIMQFWLVSWVIVDNLHHLGDEDLHVVGPLHAPLDDLLVVGVDAGVVLDHAHVGDQAAGEHLHPAVVRHDGLGDGAHAHRVHSCTGVENFFIFYSVVKLREREGVDPGRSLKGHL